MEMSINIQIHLLSPKINETAKNNEVVKQSTLKLLTHI